MSVLLQVIWYLLDYASGNKISLSTLVLKCLKHFHFCNDLIAFCSHSTRHVSCCTFLKCLCAGWSLDNLAEVGMGALRKMPLHTEHQFFRKASSPIPTMITVFSVCWYLTPYTTTCRITKKKNTAVANRQNQRHTYTFVAQFILLSTLYASCKHKSYLLPHVLGPYPKIQLQIYASCKHADPSTWHSLCF